MNPLVRVLLLATDHCIVDSGEWDFLVTCVLPQLVTEEWHETIINWFRVLSDNDKKHAEAHEGGFLVV